MAAANPQRPESACALCGTMDRPVAAYLGICLDCIRNHPDVVQAATEEAHAAVRFAERPDPPLVVASTLLVPGYVDAQEVGRIAHFIAGFDLDIPYTLLAFAPHFAMRDLGYTTRQQAQAAEAAARAGGLTRIRIGNRHLVDVGRLFHSH